PPSRAPAVQLSPQLFTLSQTMSQHKNLSLVLVVDKQANRVLWAESGGDVVDVLFSFLTLPLGTVVRVLGKQSGLGCVDELYKSVEALDESCFQKPCCKNMLLRPRSAADPLCEDLPVRVDDSDLTFYRCNWDKRCIQKYPSVYSTVLGSRCRCRGTTDRILKWEGTSTEGANGVFVDRGGKFSISDDLCISPASASTTISLLHRCRSKESQLEHMKVALSRETVLTLLHKSLTSKTPLTETFLQKSESQPEEQLHPITDHEEVTGSAGREFTARLIKSRARNELMYAEIGGDTMDLLFSFLAFPLGSVIRLMGKASRIGCMDNLYQSVANLCASKYCANLKKHGHMLLAPKIATHFGCSNQLLDIDEINFQTTLNACACTRCAVIPAPVCIHGKETQTAVQINPKLDNGSTKKGGHFAKGKPGMFMVTDQMMVTTNSSVSGLIKFMEGLNVNADDIELVEVAIGKKEVFVSVGEGWSRAPAVQLSPQLFTLSQTMSQHKNLSLVLVVDKQANRVLWAESGGDVVDVLFSFLTLPLGTAVRVLGKQSGLGCVDELYKSVEALDKTCFQTPCCQDMLLRPRSAADHLCEDLPVKVDDDLTFYTCSNKSCIEDRYQSVVFSSVPGSCCRCLGATNRIIKWGGTSTEGANGVFVDRGGRFSISDDLCISPLSASTTISLLHRFGSNESQWEHMNVDLSRETVSLIALFRRKRACMHVLTLLHKSLTSKTPLTDTFLQKSECQLPKEQLQYPISTHEEVTDSGREFKARLIKSRARDEVMYAEIGEDMADMLFSFLTIPLGSIIRLMEKASHIGCMDNLYQSVANLCAVKYCAKLEKHRDMLLAPKIATHFGCTNQLLDIIDDPMSFQTTMNKCASIHCAKIHVPGVCMHGKVAQTALQINPKLHNGSTEKGGNFAKGKPGTFMVTDEMMVMPNSSASALKFMKGRNVCVDDIELRDVAVGKKEDTNQGCHLSRKDVIEKLSDTIRTAQGEQMIAHCHFYESC
ncbi:hypothetical protein Taro_037583, partial [Colocasia esculenta]|nr:hypothetical protein [Colocasia esculenta]